MRSDLILKNHIYHCSSKSPKGNLENGEIGIGTNDKGEKILVVCCNNCGDYSWIKVKDILEVLK